MIASLFLYGFSFLVVGLWAALRITRLKWFPKELLYICSLGVSLFIFGFGFFVYLYAPDVAHALLIAFMAASPFALGSIIYSCKKTPDYYKLIRHYYLPPLLIVLVVFSLYSSVLYSCRLPVAGADTRRVPNETFCSLKTLPLDNALPQMYADFILNRAPEALVIDWSIADRPPLQIGAALPVADLSQGAPWHMRANFYNLFAIFLQLSWIGAIWALFKRLKIKTRVQIVVFIGFCATQFFYMNSVFVWPKFLAASLVVAGMMPFIGTPLTKELLRYTPIAAALITMGLMAHTGVLFTVVPFGILLAYKLYPLWKSKKISYTPLLIAALLGIAILLPWQVYKNSITTSDRLVKYHFAGVSAYDDKRGTLETIIDEYKELTFAQWLHNKLKNAETLVTGNVCTISLEKCSEWKMLSFFSTLFALELFALGLIPLVYNGIRRRLDAFDKEVIWLSLGMMLFWVLAMFEPGGTIVHQGSYATMLLLFVLLTRQLAAYPRLLIALIAAQIIIFLRNIHRPL